LRTHILLTILFFGLFIVFNISIIFTRLDRNIASLLERTQTISWQAMNGYFVAAGAALDAVMATTDDLTLLARALDRQQAVDIWFVTDEAGRILRSNLAGGSVPHEFLAAAAQSAATGGATQDFELLDLGDLAVYSPALADRAVVESAAAGVTYGALFQVLAVPYRTAGGPVRGAVVAAHLLNNDCSIARQVQREIPDSFSTISARGIRVAGNLEITDGPVYYGIGQRQDADLIATVMRGERYNGRVVLTDGLVHLVVSDPIRNSRGEVIGALTTGHPSQGLATLKRDATAYVLVSAVLSLAAAVAASSYVSHRLSLPIMRLGNVVRQLSEAEEVQQEHIDTLKALPAPRTGEIRALQTYLTEATTALYQKNQQIIGYVTRIETDRNRLHDLAQRLKHLNETLEAQVEAKTLELRVAMLDLLESNKAKDKFLANTSHELRTPLNSIIGFSDMLLGDVYGELNEQQRSRVQIIRDSADYLLRLINDLLEMAVLAQGKLQLDLQEMDLHEVVPAVASIIRQQCEEKGIRLSLQLAGGRLPITADPTRIKQVLYNLLSNSVRFTPEGGTITVTTASGPEEVKIAIRDTGIGIPEADLYHVFDEFYQAENRSSAGRGGFGLGLPLSKKLVEAHGGRIELGSRVGEGTTVTIYLPIQTEESGPVT